MPELIPDPAHASLLIADFYADMMGPLPHATDRNVIPNTVILHRAARDAGLLVCYSATVFRPGYVENSIRNKTFSQRIGSAPGKRPPHAAHP